MDESPGGYMFGTWEPFGTEAGKWHRAAAESRPRHERDPLGRFLNSVDVGLYVAIAAFAACIAAIAMR